MKKLFAGMLLCLWFTSSVFSSETIFNISGPVTKLQKWPIYSDTSFQGYRQTITVNGNTYPLLESVKVKRIDPPDTYTFIPAQFSEVQPGRQVTLRLDGHMVFEIILER